MFVIASAIHNQGALAPPDPDKDPQMSNLLMEARTLIDGKRPQLAIEKCEKVIATFKAHYGNRRERIYCALRPKGWAIW